MALFRRRKSQTISELEDYYSNGKKRSGMAWVMAFLSLLVTILVIAAIFFGGRWLYQTLTDNDDTGSTTTTETADTTPEGEVSQETVDEIDSQPEDSDEEFPSVVTDEAASTDTPNDIDDETHEHEGTDSEDEHSATDEEEVPNTGPGDVLIIAPIIAAITGYLVSIKKSLN